MRRLDPGAPASEPELLALYDADDRPPPPGRPWVMLNMVASLDGATAVQGVSGGLGGPADRQVFGLIRTVPDVIVVAAGTVRAEDYGPPVARPEAVTRRVARGQAPVPVVAVVTASASLDVSSRLFADGHRPMIITTDDAPTERVSALAPVADIVTAGTTSVDLSAALQALAGSGHRVVLLEGGPSLNGQFVAEGLVDELCLTVAPMLVSGSSKRVAVGPDAAEPEGLHLVHVLEHDDTLLLRYRRSAG